MPDTKTPTKDQQYSGWFGFITTYIDLDAALRDPDSVDNSDNQL